MAFTSLAFMLKACVFFSLQATVLAQYFAEYPLPNNWPGVSPACVTALNTTVDCSGILMMSAENNQPRLSAQNLTAVCTTSCLASLKSAKTAIQAQCKLATDVLPIGSGKYPAKFLVDLLIYTYSSNCLRDSTTHEYCDVLFAQWLNQGGELTEDQMCSDCVLGSHQLQLSSPFGYDDEFAESFASLTSSCSKPGYAYTSPPPYVPPPTAATTSAGPSSTAKPLDPGCVSLYTIRAGDTCNSIALSQGVSTYAIYGASGIADCSNLPTGSQLCLQGRCVLHKVEAGETCDGIIAAAGISTTPASFVSWNPPINSLCSNLHNSVGKYICLSRPDGLTMPNITEIDTGAVPTAAFPTIVPTEIPQLPVAPGTLAGCRNYTNYRDTTVQDSFYDPMVPMYNSISNECNYIASMNNITVHDFLSWNPSLGTEYTGNCTLAPGFSYCSHDGIHPGIPQYDDEDEDEDEDETSASPSSALPISASPTTTTPTSTTTTSTQTPQASSSSTSTSSASIPVPSPPGSVCILGRHTTNPNQEGLCSFSCHFGYCPPGPCVCTAYGTQVPEPPATGIRGYPLAGFDSSYLGLCSYTYNRGYFPTGSCTSNADGSPQA